MCPVGFSDEVAQIDRCLLFQSMVGHFTEVGQHGRTSNVAPLMLLVPWKHQIVSGFWQQKATL